MRIPLFLFSLFPIVLYSQVYTDTWAVSDTTVTVNRTTDVGVVHGYFEIFNDAERDLDMRWICKKNPDWPEEWDLIFTDPDNYHPIVEHEDSADFTLHYPPGWENKLIYGMNHHGFASSSSAHFKVFPLDFPSDSIWLNYYFNMSDSIPLSISVSKALFPVHVFWNKSKSTIEIDAAPIGSSVQIYNMSGQLITERFNLSKNETIPFNGYNTGQVLIAVILSNEGEIINRSKLF